MKARIRLSDFTRELPRFVKESVSVFNHQPSGMRAKERDLKLFVAFLKQAKRRIINGNAILDFITYLRHERHNQAGSINRKISSLRSYIRYLRFRGIEGAEGLPVEDLARARNPYPQQVEVLEPDEVKKLLRAIDRESILGARDFTLYSLLYRLGLRAGEAIALDLKDVDLKKKEIRIHGKGRRKRTLPLLDEVSEMLAHWIALRAKLKNAAQEPALFLSRKGNRLSLRTLQENFQKLVKRAGPFSVDRVVPHSMRHAFASHALETTDDLIVLKHTLGHSHLSSTEVYLHPSMRMLRSAINDHPAAQMLAGLILQGTIDIPTCQRPARMQGG